VTRDRQEDWPDHQTPRNSGRHSRPPEGYDRPDLPSSPPQYAPPGQPDPYADQYAQPDPYYPAPEAYAPPDAYAAPDPYAAPDRYAAPDPYAAPDQYADPGAQTDPARPPDPYSHPGYPAQEAFGPGHGSYDELTGPQGQNGYRGPGAGDRRAGYPEQNGYRHPEDPDQDGYRRPEYQERSSYRRPDAYPAAPGPGDRPPFRWQPSPDAAGPERTDARPGYRSGTGHEPPPRPRDWDQDPGQDWDVSQEGGEFAEPRPGPDDAGTGPRRPGPDPAGPGGRRPRPPEAGQPRERDDAPPPREGLIPGFWDGADSRPGRARRPRRRVSRVLAPLLAVALLCVLVAGGYDIYQRFQSKDFTGSGFGHVTVQVLPGASATSLAPELVRLGVVASTSSFISAAKHSPNPDGLEPGFFSLHKHMNSALAFKMLLNPASRIQTVVAIPEGLRMSQILTTLEQKSARTIPASAFTAAAKDTSALGLPAYAHGNPEGYLFPATYDFNPGTSALAMLQAMVARFKVEAASINLPAAAKTAQLTEDQVITVASILEAEAGSPKYYPQVAEVIYNRLNIGMKLGLDSTVNYALHRFGVHLTAAQLRVNSPYNTFIHTGLPPGPIDNPGDLAIKAALHPAHGNFLYFVTVNLKTGLTKFTSSPAQFQQFVAECDKNNAC
jgi:UPF0755 protein